MPRPVIAVPCNIIDYNGSPGHIVRQTYIDALLDVADVVPVFIPSSGKKISFNDLKGRIDGLLLTGSPSHVAPACYGEKQIFPDSDLDLGRDATTLPLISEVLKADLPLLAICRGFQEMNVVMGGTLHQAVHDLPGKMDHRAQKNMTIVQVYRHQAHKVAVQKGGLLEKWGAPDHFTVNTVHQQGIDKLGEGLFVEAIADDGLVECVSIPGKKFAFGTQWHPEGDTDINPVSKLIFEKFGQALRA